MRTEDDILTLKAVVLYIIEHSSMKHRDVYSIVKTAFYAQQMQFSKSGVPLFKDDICALPFGPVPSDIYDILKIARGDQSVISFHQHDGLSDVAAAVGFDAERFSAKEKPDLDYLSPADISTLEMAIQKVAAMQFEDIVNDTHSAEWDRVFHSKSRKKVMDNLKIAKEGGASPDVLEYLKEYYELEHTLR